MTTAILDAAADVAAYHYVTRRIELEHAVTAMARRMAMSNFRQGMSFGRTLDADEDWTKYDRACRRQQRAYYRLLDALVAHCETARRLP